jgi:hypothetical protein
LVGPSTNGVAADPEEPPSGSKGVLVSAHVRENRAI